jgi:hypothetical protein
MGDENEIRELATVGYTEVVASFLSEQPAFKHLYLV